ncbi:tyrosine-type recombinase/integrase [Sinorhizobium meliloti]|uniref:tyrosine-type recombinase/integrase n=1 Tax=Rhizobium meliloti TaxID=382 RepID=UPI0001E4A624|nr:integrase arm-type DNA-binding domain-containing protein [Sinorhizobium meliloti]AEG53100.1 integrase family protein [Sinorhizobium meliloti AK83]MDE4591186.1 tyrosine-type recombinase/integrase [Sinorhizobium meliloti]SEI55211.1 Integrase [Sinorhizobium meliloti]
MSLSDTKVRNAKGRDKQYKLMDDLGLYLLVKPNGSRLWRFDYQLNGKRNTLAFGKYPAVSLVDARAKRDAARNQLANGVDPSVEQKLAKLQDEFNAENTFGKVADEYLKKYAAAGKSARSIYKKTLSLKTHAATLKDRPISEIKPIEVLAVLQRLEKRGLLETAVITQEAITEVFRLAVRTARTETDPTYSLKGAVSRPRHKGRAAIIDEKQFGHLMNVIEEDDEGWPTVKYALQLLALTVVRPGELAPMEWTEIDFEKKNWTVPKERTKMRREHVVPLSAQAISILNEMKKISHHGKFVFEGRFPKQPIHKGTMGGNLRRLGFGHDQHVPHGFRSSFSTILNERQYDPQIIEHSLAHVDGTVRGIYNRAKFLEPRRELLQTWANLVDEFKARSKALPEAAE